MSNIFVSVLTLVLWAAALLTLQPALAFADSASSQSADNTPKTVYVCPMHPQATFDQPGQCPVCHMDLVKKEAPAKQESTDKK
jgi:membrane fusion protein, copper/silver efflux system